MKKLCSIIALILVSATAMASDNTLIRTVGGYSDKTDTFSISKGTSKVEVTGEENANLTTTFFNEGVKAYQCQYAANCYINVESVKDAKIMVRVSNNTSRAADYRIHVITP